MLLQLVAELAFLVDVVVGAFTERAPRRLQAGVGGHQHDARVGPAAPDRGEQRHAVGRLHAQIGDDRVERRRFHLLQRRVAAVHEFHVVPGVAQVERGEFRVAHLVIHHEHPHGFSYLHS